MSSSLASLFRGAHKTQFPTHISDALLEYFRGKSVESTAVKKMLTEIEKEKKISLFLQKFFVLVFLAKDVIYAHQDLLRSFLDQHIDRAELFGENLLLYQVISIYLDPGPKNRELPIVTSDLSSNPKFLEETLSATLCYLLYYLLEQKEYATLCNRYRERVGSFLDHKERPMLTLWCKEEEYNPFSFLCSYYIYLDTLPIDEEEKKRIYATIEKEPLQDSLIFYMVLEIILKEIPKELLSSLQDQEKIADFLSYKKDHFTLACTLTGMNHSLGAFRKENVECKAFGPQYYPLDDVRGFGIYRPPWMSGGPLKIGADGHSINGWFPMSQELGKSWSEVALHADEEKLSFSFQLFGEQKGGMAFYMNAASCFIGTREIFPHSLEHFKNSVDRVVFQTGDEKVIILLDQPREIECISLAGKNFFWNSDYLLFLPNKNKEKISLTIAF